MRFQDRRVIVTGGTSGIGRDLVERFHAEGAEVYFSGRSADRGAAVAAESGPRARFVRGDMSDPDDVARLIRAASAEGPVHCVVNNAAATEVDTIDTITPDVLSESMWSVFGSVVLVTKAAIPVIPDGGSIINIGSTAAHRGNSSPPVYSSLKAAVIHLTRCLALELGDRGIRVNAVSPGAIATPIFQGLLGLGELSREKAMPLIHDALAAVNPSGRAGVGADVAEAVVFLASDETRYITGQDIVVDGGLTAGNTPVGRAAERAIIADVITKGTLA
ncbi:SDR family NAD(P)-dependent oxidoreductase [Tsukamurella tyrosinosolvens]|uniref:SDR family NAD(P)-dependent oxidoreductase n=1 Tax=Tsukamurella tyrosinosolvens TaxID=57704 RepID=UPI00083802DD|nr:SDR family oxidoreductase [Tsukamurella tyrosinosolvens]